MKTAHVNTGTKNPSILRQIRKELGLKQEEFADRIGVSRRSVIRWENGDFRPTLTIPQIKALEKELSKLKKSFNDLPDDL